MKFSRSRNYDFPAEFTIGDSRILEEKSELKILGVMVGFAMHRNDKKSHKLYLDYKKNEKSRSKAVPSSPVLAK